jgi:hypothetical protein
MQGFFDVHRFVDGRHYKKENETTKNIERKRKKKEKQP